MPKNNSGQYSIFADDSCWWFGKLVFCWWPIRVCRPQPCMTGWQEPVMMDSQGLFCCIKNFGDYNNLLRSWIFSFLVPFLDHKHSLWNNACFSTFTEKYFWFAKLRSKPEIAMSWLPKVKGWWDEPWWSSNSQSKPTEVIAIDRGICSKNVL